MVTIQDIGSEIVYNAALREIKSKLSLRKKLFKNKFTREEAQEVKELNIAKVSLENFDFLRFFPNLETIRIEYVTGITDISGIQNCIDLKVFESTNSDIEHLENIIYCKSLTNFTYYLEGEYKKYGKNDFSFLQSLLELKMICVTGNMLEDTSCFEKLQNLEFMVLEGNPIKTISPLKALKQLNHLELEDCGLSELEDLSEFEALKTVYAEGNFFTEEQKQSYRDKYPDIDIDFEN